MRAVLFDVFGTVVDWRGSVIAAGERLSQRSGVRVEWGAFADDWRRTGYLKPIVDIVFGGKPYEEVDVLMRRRLDELVIEHGLSGVPAEEIDAMEAVWHQLDPWPDVVEGLTAMKQRCIIGPLSNGGFRQLTEMAKYAGLPWDCVISSALFGSYKPDARVYRGAVELLGLAAREVMLVAAHGADLRSAKEAGLRTGYVPRPLEWGFGSPDPEPPDPSFDVVAADFVELAGLL